MVYKYYTVYIQAEIHIIQDMQYTMQYTYIFTLYKTCRLKYQRLWHRIGNGKNSFPLCELIGTTKEQWSSFSFDFIIIWEKFSWLHISNLKLLSSSQYLFSKTIYDWNPLRFPLIFIFKFTLFDVGWTSETKGKKYETYVGFWSG